MKTPMKFLFFGFLWTGILPLFSETPGVFTHTGITHPFSDWDDWAPMNLAISYFNLEASDKGLRLWLGASFEGKDSMIRLEGTSIADLNRPPPLFDTRIVQGYDMDLDGADFPILSRGNGLRLRDGSELVQGAIGPRYTGGGSELYPALFLKTPGESWIHLGPPSGEPEAVLKKVRQHNAQVRCESGGLIELPDGRLRIYLHGVPKVDMIPSAIRNKRLHVGTLLVAESDTPEGPWSFLRHPDGSVINLLENTPKTWTFLHIQPLGTLGYMLTGADAWPPTRIFAAYSRDGLHFITPASRDSGERIPLMSMGDVSPDAKFCKALRGALHPDDTTFTAIMNISRPADRGRSMLHHSQARFDKEAFREFFP